MIFLPRFFLIALLVLLSAGSAPVFAEENQQVDPAPLLERLKERPASLRGEAMPVALLLRGIGRQAGVNILVADSVNDTINVDMDQVSLYDVFQAIVESKRLRYRQKNQVILIDKKTETANDQRDFVTEQVCARYGNAKDFADQVKALLGPQGSVVPSGRGNCLILRDSATNLPKVRAMLTELDQPTPQVHIEARIVTISNEAKRRLGIVWRYQNDRIAAFDKNNTVNSSFPGADLANPVASMAFGFIRSNFDLNVSLQAMQAENLLSILSSPSILVLDGTEGKITQGKEVPYTTGGTANIPSSTSFREANLGLSVKPTILRDGSLILEAEVTNDSVDQPSQAGTQPIINKQHIKTNLFLEDGVTVVIGGIVQKSSADQENKVPGLGDLPLLGNLFKNTVKVDDQSELMVFITPRVVGDVRRAGGQGAQASPTRTLPGKAGASGGIQQER